VRVCQLTATKAVRVCQGSVAAVVTDRGEVAARHVVLAGGIWSNLLLEPLGQALPLYWHRVEVCFFRRPDPAAEHPIIADFVSRCYFRPEPGRLTLAGGIPVMRPGVSRPLALEGIDHPDHFREGVSPATIRELSEKLAARMPAFARGYWRRGHACVYDVTPDWHPILSLSREVRGLFVAAGFSGHGFVMSPAVGRIVAEAVVGPGGNQEEIELLGPERFEQGRPVAFAVG
jgi:glycine/D-amino acid oxidase-like deaminating enzyme